MNSDTVNHREYREEVPDDEINAFNERHVSKKGALRRQCRRSIEDIKLAKQLGLDLEDLK